TLPGERQRLGDADVEHQPVEPAEALDAALDQRLEGVGLAHVGQLAECGPTFGGDGLAGRLERIRGNVDAGESGAFASEQDRHRPAVADRRVVLRNRPLASADDEDSTSLQATPAGDEA